MLPDELKVILAGLITVAVTDGLKVVSNWLGKDLSGKAAAFAAVLTSLVVLFAETIIGLVPEQYAGFAQAILTALVALLGAFGVHRQLKLLRQQVG